MVNAMFVEVGSHSRHAEFRSLGVNFFFRRTIKRRYAFDETFIEIFTSLIRQFRWLKCKWGDCDVRSVTVNSFCNLILYYSFEIDTSNTNSLCLTSYSERNWNLFQSATYEPLHITSPLYESLASFKVMTAFWLYSLFRNLILFKLLSSKSLQIFHLPI